MYLLAVVLVGIIVCLLVEVISLDAIIISISIIVAACIISSTIKKQMKTRQNNDSKDENDNE